MASRSELPWIGIIAAGVVVGWWFCIDRPAAPGPVSFASGDLFAYFQPAYGYIAERLRAGALPWWNPWVGGGTPFVATLQPGALYPARILLLLLPVPAAMQASLVAHLVLAGSAMYLLARALRVSRSAALLAAAMFVVVAELPSLFFPPFLEAGAWLPIAGLAIVRVLARGSVGWSALLGVALAMPILAGGYHTSVYVVYGALCFGLVQLAVGARAIPGSLLARRLGVAALLALAVAAPQLFVTLAWTSGTARSTAALNDSQIQPFFHPSLVPELVRIFLAQLVVPNGRPSPIHLSIPGVILVLVGVVTHGRLGALIGVCALPFLLLSLGPGLPWFPLYHWLPALSWFRLPGRLMFIVAYFVAIAAALGSVTLGRWTRRRDGTARRWVEPALLVVVVLALLGPVRNPWALPWTSPPDLPFPGEPVFAAAAAHVGDGRLWVPAANMALGLGSFPRLGLLEHVRVLQDYEPLAPRRLGQLLRAIAGTAEPTEAWARPFAGAIAETTIAHPALLDAAGVTAIVLPQGQPPPERDRPWTLAADVSGFRVWRNPDALPRAYVVGRAVGVSSDEDALAQAMTPGFDPGREAFVVADTAELPRTEQAEPVPQRILDDGPEHLRIGLQVEAPGVLVVSDMYADGWSATVDGVERPVWSANGFGRAVRVAPGDRVAELVYRPPGLRAAVVVSVLAGLSACVLALWS